MISVLLVAALSTVSHGFLLDSVTTQALANQVQNVRTLAEAVKVMSTLLREVDELKRVINTHELEVKQLQGEVTGHQGELQKLRQALTQLTAAVGAINADGGGGGAAAGGSGGAVYTRWGRTSCPSQTELVYKGYTGGKGYGEVGGGTNLLCMPEDPQWANYTLHQSGSSYAHVWGAEYQTDHDTLPNFHANHDAPCAVCRSPRRSSALMVPARTDCYPSFHREYTGYLMSNLYTAVGDYEFVCVDSQPESEVGSQRDDNGVLLYFTVGICGSLPCPPYVAKREIPCVVCTK